jgi:hypothetical protein
VVAHDQLVVDQAAVAEVGEADLVDSAIALASPETQPLCLSALQILHDSRALMIYQLAKPIFPLPPWMIYGAHPRKSPSRGPKSPSKSLGELESPRSSALSLLDSSPLVGLASLVANPIGSTPGNLRGEEPGEH